MREEEVRSILQGLRTHIIKYTFDLAADLPISVIRNAHSAGIGYSFKTSRNIDAIAKNIVVIEDDVTDMNANSKFDPFVLWHVGIPIGHAALDVGRAPRRIDGAGKLDQHAVPGGLDDATAMRGNRRVENGFTERFEHGQRAFFVRPHKAAVPGDIRSKHRRQSPLDVFFGQMAPWKRVLICSYESTGGGLSARCNIFSADCRTG